MDANLQKRNIKSEGVDPKEFEEAEKAARQANDLVYTLTLASPLEHEGAFYSKLTFNWGKLSGRDGLNIEIELQAHRIALIAPTFSGEYLIRMAAKSCEQPIDTDALLNLSISDYNRIRNSARSFLLKSELSVATAEHGSDDNA